MTVSGCCFAAGLLLLIGLTGGDPIPRSCVTPSGSAGQCVPLEQCSNLYAIKQLSPANAKNDLLKRAECDALPAGKGVCCQPERIFALPEKCGLASYDRIANGNETAVFEFPWMALLMYRDTLEDELTPNCGGSLISDRYVLTAAHCLTENAHSKLEFVRLGEHTISKQEDCNNYTLDGVVELDCAGPVEDVAIESVIKHSDHRRKFGGHDIGLIRLARKIVFKDHIQPICLPLHPELKNVLLPEYYVAGWGYTETMERSDVLLKAKLERVETPTCQKQIDEVARTSRKKIKITLDDKQICAGGKDLVDSCQGDSGGPLMWLSKVRNQSRYVLFGVVSFGIENCGLINFPGVYVRVGSYLGWIMSNMKA
ncbi:serine protease easter [Culex quinquefasciatus]|uniref:serine protease easter n=1 Tax=Culex quinquefasciatus TaxID=7176 RepID=UPI0018E3F037|nr:serine protease easter [Culex quinquefasciatus]